MISFRIAMCIAILLPAAIEYENACFAELRLESDRNIVLLYCMLHLFATRNQWDKANLHPC
jgi:hypothetical protein